MAILLIKHVRTLRGGSQPHLMQAADGNCYVVKFQNNPQGTNVLANELLAAKLASVLGLPVPCTVVVELSTQFGQELYFEVPCGREPIRPGLHVGSRLVVTSLKGRTYDCLPRSSERSLRNIEDLVGIQLFDLWTCNRDRRQTIFWKYARDKKYTAAFIDNGHCFGGPEWKFFPLTLQNITSTAFAAVSWRQWADRIATFPIRQFENDFIDQLPSEWLDAKNHLALIFEELRSRQAIFAEAIKDWVAPAQGNKIKAQRVSGFMDTMRVSGLSAA